MTTAAQTNGTGRRPIKHLRWWIGGLLFASTVINYIDRQTFSVLGPYLKIEYHWNNEQFALIIIAFRVAYSIGQTVSGRAIPRNNSERRPFCSCAVPYPSTGNAAAKGTSLHCRFLLRNAAWCRVVLHRPYWTTD